MKLTLEGEEKTRGGLESSVLVGLLETRTKQVSVLKAKNPVNLLGDPKEFSHGVAWLVIHISHTIVQFKFMYP